MTHLHRYVADLGDTWLPTMCSGDGLSVERMLHAQKARAFAEQEDNRLSSLIPAPQEFHKEIRLMQVRLQIDMDNCDDYRISPMTIYSMV